MRVSGVPIVVPAYRPGKSFCQLVEDLAAGGAAEIVVVNDGSGHEYERCFDSIRDVPGVHVLDHAVNLGKGAAIKTGIGYAIRQFPGCTGIVTADADGQHATADIVRIRSLLADHPDSLVLGVRAFGPSVPRRSQVGNQITRHIVRVVIGRKLRDTQTGLRGIPASLAAELLRIPSNGYEFEMDMLVASKHLAYPVREEPIRTIYEEGNPSSHFNPIRDSLRIYFVLLRFAALSFLTAILDNTIFLTVFLATRSIWESQIAGRLGAILFNYLLARRAVFQSRERHASTLPKYLALVAVNGLISYAMIGILNSSFQIPVFWSKILAESTLFLLNFAIQRDIIFTRGRSGPAPVNNVQHELDLPSPPAIT
jgi:putative flippase GtrA